VRRVILAIVFIIIGSCVLLFFKYFYLRGLSEPSTTIEQAVAEAQENAPVRMTFGQLRQWIYRYPDKRNPPPEKLNLVKDKKIVIEGYQFVTNSATVVSSFALSQFCYGCCFRGEPALNEFIEVSLPAGMKPIPYAPAKPIRVMGRLEWGEKVEGGYTTSIYRLVAEDISLKS